MKRVQVALLAGGFLVMSQSVFAQQTEGSGDPAPAENPDRSFATYGTAATSTGTAGTPPAPVPRISQAQLMDTGAVYPRVEWHGYFRFRADSFWNLDLDTAGTSPVLPPIESLLEPGTATAFEPNEIPATGTGEDGNPIDVPQFANSGAEHIGGANIRMRLRPIFHVTENARIHLEMNILDNLVMGSTPDGFNEIDLRGLRIDSPILGFTRGQEPPNVFNAGRSSISVTQAYGEVRPFFGVIRVGRMASHWGLGMIANGGGSYSTLDEPRASMRFASMQGHTCMDCDFGDYVDRALFLTKAFNTYLTLGWDYNASGPTDINPDEYFGQAREISNYDDVRSYFFTLFQRPLSEEEIAARNETLKVDRRATFDWGAYTSYRVQRLSSEGFNAVDNDLTTGDVNFIARGARAVIPDVWLRLQSEPRFRRRIRLEGEFAGIFGSIDNAQINAGSAYSQVRPRTIQQMGGAVEFEYVNMSLATGINSGFATGRSFDNPDDPAVGFGVTDQFDFNDNETKLTNFQFDRNYFVDMIMFREVIGTVTNAYYFNPFVSYDLFARDQSTLGVRLDVIGGMAMKPESTPSGDGFYGIETDLGFFYQEARFMTDITAGFYVPGSAFDGKTGRPRLSPVDLVLQQGTVYTSDVAATPAWTVQGRFMWAF
jgi:uncharacterized protein (TIGR04551 family)